MFIYTVDHNMQFIIVVLNWWLLLAFPHNKNNRFGLENIRKIGDFFVSVLFVFVFLGGVALLYPKQRFSKTTPRHNHKKFPTFFAPPPPPKKNKKKSDHDRCFLFVPDNLTF